MPGKPTASSRTSHRHLPHDLVAFPLGGLDANPRRRVFRACVYCRQRKIRCSGQESGCSNCFARHHECTYTAVTKEENERAKSKKQIYKKAVKAASTQRTDGGESANARESPPALPAVRLSMSPPPAVKAQEPAASTVTTAALLSYIQAAPAKPTVYPQPCHLAPSAYLHPSYTFSAPIYPSQVSSASYEQGLFPFHDSQFWHEELESGPESPANSADDTYSYISRSSSFDARPYTPDCSPSYRTDCSPSYRTIPLPTWQPYPALHQYTIPQYSLPANQYYFSAPEGPSITLSDVCPLA